MIEGNQTVILDKYTRSSLALFADIVKIYLQI